MSARPPDSGRPGGSGPPEDLPEHKLGPTPPSVIGVCVIVGLVGGWSLHLISARAGNPPLVGWLPTVTLAFVDAALGATAWLTWRALQRDRGRLFPHEAVNRLAMAKACVIVGSLCAGGYAGYALSWVGDKAELAGERMTHSIAAALAGALMVLIALGLERACRVRDEDEEA